MPWTVKPGDRRCTPDKPVALVKTETDQLVACHVDEAAANEQRAALMANMPEAEDMPMSPPPTS